MLKKVMIGLLIVVVAIPAMYYMSLVVFCPVINDVRAAKIEKEFFNIPVPPKTEIVESYSFCGNTSGTGNHVEIWSGILVKSELPETELIQWAEGISMSNIVYEPLLWAVPEDRTSQYPQSRKFIEFEHFNGMSEAKRYYIMGGYFDAVTQHDIRGH